ncbi:MAG: integrase [Clostridium sp.]
MRDSKKPIFNIRISVYYLIYYSYYNLIDFHHYKIFEIIFLPFVHLFLHQIHSHKKLQDCNNLAYSHLIDDAQLLRSQWRDVCKDAELPKYKLYATRHTFATLMLKENIVSINELAGLLGHSSPKVTLEHYASVIDSNSINLGANFSLFRHNTDTLKDMKVNEPL